MSNQMIRQKALELAASTADNETLKQTVFRAAAYFEFMRGDVAAIAAQPEPAPPFKPGDVVVALQDAYSGGIVKGFRYTVAAYEPHHSCGEPCLELAEYPAGSFRAEYFACVVDDGPLKVGDRVTSGASGDVYEVCAPPRMWERGPLGAREEIAAWSDDTGYTQLFVTDCHRVQP